MTWIEHVGWQLRGMLCLPHGQLHLVGLALRVVFTLLFILEIRGFHAALRGYAIFDVSPREILAHSLLFTTISSYFWVSASLLGSRRPLSWLRVSRYAIPGITVLFVAIQLMGARLSEAIYPGDHPAVGFLFGALLVLWCLHKVRSATSLPEEDEIEACLQRMALMRNRLLRLKSRLLRMRG